MIKILFLLYSLLVSSLAVANCNTVNLITAKNSPFTKIPVYDQDGVGICYAYAASQLIDYHLIKNGGSRSVHPLWAALKYTDSEKQKQISSGNTYETILALKKYGNCDQKKVSNAIKLWASKANVKEAEVIHLIEKLAPEMKSLLSKKRVSDPKANSLNAKEVETAINKAIELHAPYCSPGATWDKLLPSLRPLLVLNSTELLSHLVMPDCSSNITELKLPNPTKLSSSSDSGWSNIIQNKLSNNTPISISYCATVLKSGPSYDGITERGGIFTNNKYSKNCGFHESLIVGKKLINNQCHFLLRNSWGSGFGSSTKKWNCLCKNKKTGSYLDNCTANKHNNGQYTVEGCWVNAEALAKNTYKGVSLEAPKAVTVEDLQRDALKKPWY